MFFVRDFTKYFGSNFEYGHDAPITKASVWDDILDFEDLQLAWEEEVARRNPPVLAPTSVSSTRQPERSCDAEKSKDSDKIRRVFVVHGRDEKLRSGIFACKALQGHALAWLGKTKISKKVKITSATAACGLAGIRKRWWFSFW